MPAASPGSFSHMPAGGPVTVHWTPRSGIRRLNSKLRSRAEAGGRKGVCVRQRGPARRRLIARDVIALAVDTRYPLPPSSRPPPPDPAGRPAAWHRFDLLLPPAALSSAAGQYVLPPLHYSDPADTRCLPGGIRVRVPC